MGLEQALEQTLEQKFKFRFNNHPKKICEKDILFFPRKIVKVKKFKSGRWEPRSWFISERTNKYATGLEEPTSKTQEALYSGLRSVIIKQDNDYIKLKGVAPKTQLAQGGIRGLCNFHGAFFESLNAHLLLTRDFPTPITPRFIEMTIPFRKIKDMNGLKEFLYLFSLPRYAIHFNKKQKKFDLLVKDYNSFEKEVDYFSTLCFVSAFNIKGDTRMDEVFYHLTKKDLKGDKKEIRDELMIYLSYRAGFSKSYLSQIGMALGKEFLRTNSHIGNFAIYPEEGSINVGLTDLAGIQFNTSFDDSENLIKKSSFLEHLKRELEEFRKDYDDPASSFSSHLRYKFFTEELKDRCFAALKTGYQVQRPILSKANKCSFGFIRRTRTNCSSSTDIYYS